MKKILLILIIIIIVLGGVFYIRSRNTNTQESGTKSTFKSFFNFGSRNKPESTTPENGTSSDFTENETGNEENLGSGAPTQGTKSIFGNSGPFTPTLNSNGGIDGGLGIGGGTLISGGGLTGSSDINGNGGINGNDDTSTNTTNNPRNTLQCTDDDTVIEFTPEEIARLRILEDRFYALAPTLRTDEDLRAETANYSSYKLLNQKYTEMITYCENKSPLLPSTINKRVSTPFYTDSSTSMYFSNGPDADGVIDLQSTESKPREIERFFRINIW